MILVLSTGVNGDDFRMAGADPASKFRGGDFSNICWSGLATASLL